MDNNVGFVLEGIKGYWKHVVAMGREINAGGAWHVIFPI